MEIAILYGSQTGTAQDVAEQIWRESKAWTYAGPVLAMDDFPLEHYTSKAIIIFVVATTGDGEAPDNMRKTWRSLLRRSLPPTTLEGLQFACLGLGDSSYTKFNFAAKKLSKRLVQLGAKEIVPIGLCDDQHDYGLSAVALPWIKKLWEKLSEDKNNGKPNAIDPKKIFKCKVHVLENTPETTAHNASTYLSWPYRTPSYSLKLMANKRVTADDHFQDVRLLQFVVPEHCTWNPGDVLQVHPCNSDEKVAEFFQLLQEHNIDLNAETIVRIESAHENMEVPLVYKHPVTLGDLAKYVWDFNFKPRQRSFELLSLNCVDELEKEKLEEFASADGIDSLIAYINRPKRTLLEVLHDFRNATTKLTLPILLELFPIIQPRSFSIASIPPSGSVDLLVAVVEYKTKLSTPRLGLCSNWLKSLNENDIILGSFKSGTMRLPKQLSTPIIMVGPGTGIAPFRSIIQYYAEQHKLSQSVGELIVFFGCRNRSKDFYFEHEFMKWQSEGLIKLFVAFSRDQANKVYVQDLIRQEKQALTHLLNDDAYVLLAGSSKNMPKGVRDAFTEILGGNASYVDQMVQSKRYQEETWS